MNLQSYWEKAISFDEYIKIAEERIHNNPNKEDEHQSYYELGLQRMKRTLKTFKKDPDLLEVLKSKSFNGKVLIITEPWCGDASATVPALVKFFEDHNEVKIFLKDDDLSLINQFLTNGTQSIPIAILLDENHEVINHWGPRPKYGMELLAKFKADPETYTKETFHNDLQIYYAKNRGKDVIEELLTLL